MRSRYCRVAGERNGEVHPLPRSTGQVGIQDIVGNLQGGRRQEEFGYVSKPSLSLLPKVLIPSTTSACLESRHLHVPDKQ